jgi:hypothetical protein
VIVGGLVTSTLLNLFVTPALYARFGYRRADQRERDPLVDLRTEEADEAARAGAAIQV